jgi:hypothetical protein
MKRGGGTFVALSPDILIFFTGLALLLLSAGGPLSETEYLSSPIEAPRPSPKGT